MRSTYLRSRQLIPIRTEDDLRMARAVSKSAGVLLYRWRDGRLQVMLVHPGGPFWSGKDEGAWSIPKGAFEEGESPLEAARREFEEETGFEVEGRFIDLGEARQSDRKTVHVWALEGDLDEKRVVSNRFSLEWPRGSGVVREYPEIDKASWFDLQVAMRKIHKGQSCFLFRLMDALDL